MGKTGVITFLIVILTSGCLSQNLGLNFHHREIEESSDNLQYYIGENEHSQSIRALLYLDGSGTRSAQENFGIGAEASLYGYCLVYPEKPYYSDPELFIAYDNRQNRLRDTRWIIDDLIALGYEEILILAVSEATMFAPELAAEYPDTISGLISIAGSLNTFREDLVYLAQNQQSSSGIIWNEEELQTAMKNIDGNPDDTQAIFWGHSFSFWSSYLDYSAVENLKDLACPVLYINGTEDEINMELHLIHMGELQAEGTPIEYILYPGVGHNLGGLRTALLKNIENWGTENGIF